MFHPICLKIIIFSVPINFEDNVKLNISTLYGVYTALRNCFYYLESFNLSKARSWTVHNYYKVFEAHHIQLRHQLWAVFVFISILLTEKPKTNSFWYSRCWFSQDDWSCLQKLTSSFSRLQQFLMICNITASIRHLHFLNFKTHLPVLNNFRDNLQKNLTY